MPAWYGTASLQALLDDIKTKVTTIHLLSSYSIGQDYATVTGNSIGSAAITGAGNFTGPTPQGNDMRLVFDGVGGTASASDPGGTLHIALTSGTEVLCVTEETSQQPITDLNPITFPTFYMQSSQPTVVP